MTHEAGSGFFTRRPGVAQVLGTLRKIGALEE